MRAFLRGRPGQIIGVGLALMASGLYVTYFLIAIAYGGFLYEPVIVQVIAFSITGGLFLTGLALVLVGGYRCCRSFSSN